MNIFSDEFKYTFNLETFFNSEAKKPFSCNIKFNECENCYKLFEKIKQIFIVGLLYNTKDDNIIIENKEKKLLMTKITTNEINIVKKYMLSIGIEVIHKEYTIEDTDYHIRNLLYELEKNFKDIIKIDVTMDWVKQLIHKIQVTLDNSIEKSTIEKFNSTLRKYPEANYFLKLYTPTNIDDYVMSYFKENTPNILNVIYFKPADVVNYQYQHNHTTQFTKHVK